MKRFLALILTIVMMVSMICACGQKDVEIDKEIDQKPSVLDPTDNVGPTKGNDDKQDVESPSLENHTKLDTKYAILYTCDFTDITEDEYEERIEEAIEENDVDEVNELFSKCRIITVNVPYIEGWAYECYGDSLDIVTDDGSEASVLIETIEDGADIEKQFSETKKIGELDVEGVVGAIYDTENPEMPVGYAGTIDNSILFLAAASNQEDLISIMNSIKLEKNPVKVESEFKENEDVYSRTLRMYDYDVGLQISNTDKYMFEAGTFGILAISKDTECEDFEIQFDTFDVGFDEINIVMESEEDDIYYVETECLSGIIVSAEDSLIFYGVDMNTLASAAICGYERTIDEMIEFIKSISLKIHPFVADDIEILDDSYAQLDDSYISDFVDSIKMSLSLSDDVYNSVKGYIKDFDSKKGIEITLFPENVDGNMCYVFENGVINHSIGGKTTLREMEQTLLIDDILSFMWNSVNISSQRYKNSSVTIFIEMDDSRIYNSEYKFNEIN